jgi:hypothetical protein
MDGQRSTKGKKNIRETKQRKVKLSPSPTYIEDRRNTYKISGEKTFYLGENLAIIV